MKCILRERLYVPAEFVQDEHLDAFTYNFEANEQVYDEDGRPAGQTKGIVCVRNFKRIKASSGQQYVGFARGNIAKLGEYFGDHEWEDRTAAPPMTSGLAITSSLKLKTYDQDGVGQQEVVEKWLSVRNGIIKASPRFGKTICSVYLIVKMGLKTLVVTHQEDLLLQFISEFERFTNLKNIRNPSRDRRDATGHVVGLFSDFDNPEELDVCFICWQTFASKYGPERLSKYRNAWGLLVGDEIHKSGSFVYASVLNETNARHRLGLTGTLKRVDGKDKLVTDIMGPAVVRGKVKQVPCGVTVIRTGVEVKFTANEPLPRIYQRLYRDPDRQRLILKYLEEDVADGFYICIGFHRHGRNQLEHFTEVLQDRGIRAEAFHGSTPDREGVLARFRSGETQVAVCNVGMLTGINIPRWNAFYRMFPSANVTFEIEDGVQYLSGSDKQEFDRIRTPFVYENGAVKQMGLIRDFVDENKFCYGCFKKREKAYKNQKFMIEHISHVSSLKESL